MNPMRDKNNSPQEGMIRGGGGEEGGGGRRDEQHKPVERPLAARRQKQKETVPTVLYCILKPRIYVRMAQKGDSTRKKTNRHRCLGFLF